MNVKCIFGNHKVPNDKKIILKLTGTPLKCYCENCGQHLRIEKHTFAPNSFFIDEI
jgi:hypothetical protein